jgi:peptidoglycan hydrolase-like protein with peptidoglycan-binding domain
MGFFCLLAGVTANAIYLQPAPGRTGTAPHHSSAVRPVSEHARKPPVAAPAPRAAPHRAAAREEEPALKIARFAPDAAKLASTPPGEGPPREIVRALQRELKQRGYGPLPGDGTLTLATRAAIMAYENDQGLPLTAVASEALLKRILFAPPPSPPTGAQATNGAAARAPATPEAEEVVRSVQHALVQLGYQPGRPDGRLGEETLQALSDFEVDKGLVPKKRISAELIARLQDASPGHSGAER